MLVIINTQACLTIAQLIIFDNPPRMHQRQRKTGTLQVEKSEPSFVSWSESSFVDKEQEIG